ncbi:MAG: hypothetical protein MK100_09165, partial [Phycisphaerales bacterium]|nr:hypothetical protein [Phycisphaerales bacterium]
SCTTDFGLWTLQSFHFQEGMTPLMDLNGDGAPEMLLESPYHDYSIDDGHSGEYNRPMLIARSGEQVGHIDIFQVLDISPNSISYNGLNWPPKGNPNLWFIAEYKGFFDVTGDGRLDIILDVQLNIEWNPGEWTEIRQFFYIENTSSPVAAACSSDIDDSGAVDISDLLTVISDWGPCEGG